jgi:hypothetical protein
MRLRLLSEVPVLGPVMDSRLSALEGQISEMMVLMKALMLRQSPTVFPGTTMPNTESQDEGLQTDVEEAESAVDPKVVTLTMAQLEGIVQSSFKAALWSLPFSTNPFFLP